MIAFGGREEDENMRFRVLSLFAWLSLRSCVSGRLSFCRVCSHRRVSTRAVRAIRRSSGSVRTSGRPDRLSLAAGLWWPEASAGASAGSPSSAVCPIHMELSLSCSADLCRFVSRSASISFERIRHLQKTRCQGSLRTTTTYTADRRRQNTLELLSLM